MVSKAELVAVSKNEKIPLGIIEKDYVLTLILKKIYETEFKDKLIFKGGTALHKLYLHKRFSIDLDFTVLRKINPDDLKRIIEIKEILSRIKDINDIGNSTRIIVGYVSVLEFANRIFLDLSKREKPILSLIKKTVHSPFFEDFKVMTYQLEELLAEKIRALMQRKKPRDYLDLYYIAKSGKADFEIAVTVARKKISSFSEDFDKSAILDDTELVRHLWDQDLKAILPRAPSFETVIETIRLSLEPF